MTFSCKRRGLCPVCGARRMAETGAYLIDHAGISFGASMERGGLELWHRKLIGYYVQGKRASTMAVGCRV